MKRLSGAARFLAAYALASALLSCGSTPCLSLEGTWEAEEGHLWAIRPDGQMLWITRFGSQFDTVRLTYHYDCSRTPAAIDLLDFDGGPWQGKTLYGILEPTSDTSFRFCAAAGADASVRPEYFDQTETVRFFRERR
ncbi:MAG: hypothetical protein RMJ33_12885 [Saprospiraceae bacterium]|nr:hypothetical protein [Saprospiraceae bacterium]MDW8230723.1 hypothetical protein [Saprospiraceae bacterium]